MPSCGQKIQRKLLPKNNYLNRSLAVSLTPIWDVLNPGIFFKQKNVISSG